MHRRTFVTTSALAMAGLAAPFLRVAAAAKRTGTGGATIRILILESGAPVEITGQGLVSAHGGKRASLPAQVAVSRAGRKVTLNNISSRARDVIRLTSSQGMLTVDGRAYRGAIEVWPGVKSALAVINDVPLEIYIAGVLGLEMDSTWPAEALKAQAVVARTYAVERQRRQKPTAVPSYDLTATVQDQVYQGLAGETASTREAAYATYGQVLRYRGRLAQVYYHSTCGGRTLSSASVWGADYPYMRGVEDGFCEDSPRYFWTYTLTLDALRDRLARAGYRMDRLTHITADSTTTLDPVRRVQCLGRPRPLTLTGADLRRAVGYSYIFSTRFILREEPADNAVTFLGSGAGHGVGLCQWGARGMAAEGIDYRAIIEKYFPGTDIGALA